MKVTSSTTSAPVKKKKTVKPKKTTAVKKGFKNINSENAELVTNEPKNLKSEKVSPSEDSSEVAKLNRGVNAILVPYGSEIFLPAGTEVTITQSLGDNFTVIAQGQMVRIEGKDADALGKTVPIDEIANNPSLSLEDKVWAKLRTCYDPEIPINIVDLGLVYKVLVEPYADIAAPKEPLANLPQDSSEPAIESVQQPAKTSASDAPAPLSNEQQYKVIIRMTLTAPGCGMGPILANEAKAKVLSLPNVKDVEIEVVFDPPWDRSMMSTQAKLELGMLW